MAKVEVDDLDILTTPEMIMLSAVSGEGVQGRLILTPVQFFKMSLTFRGDLKHTYCATIILQ